MRDEGETYARLLADAGVELELQRFPDQLHGFVHLVGVSRSGRAATQAVTDRVAGFNELLTTLVDAVLAKTTMRQNNDMRKITAYAAMISVPTMIAGIYGMNFQYMPELQWRYGYPMVLVTLAQLRLRRSLVTP